jgi:arginine-tRNA-protein transferase
MEVRFSRFTGITAADDALFAAYSASTDFDGYSSLSRCLYGVDKPRADSLFDTRVVSVWDGNRLVGRGLFDVGANSVMGKINYFDPAYRSYSPSKFMMLKIIEKMRTEGWEWFYPGYIIVGRPKFNYKLFLGKEAAEYYDPESGNWRLYDDAIMLPEVRTEEEDMQLIRLHILSLFGFDEQDAAV